MRKFAKYITITFAFIFLVYSAGLLADKQKLQEDLIRLHVVANSDSDYDQTVKLQVRDAITEYLNTAIEKLSDKHEVMHYLQSHLIEIEEVANQALEAANINDRANVTLKKEAFDARYYDTFKLPAGVYDSLRVEIGEGKGRNWWCVVFPSLCLPATGTGFQDTAVSAGFDETLTGTLSGNEKYEIRFFLLDCMGRLENFFFYK